MIRCLNSEPLYNEYVSSSEVVQVSTEGVEQLETYFSKYLPQLFYSLLAPNHIIHYIKSGKSKKQVSYY